MAISHPIPVEILRQLIRLDAETGKLYWLARGPEWFAHCRNPVHLCTSWNSRHAGREALTAGNGKGYRRGTVLGCMYYAHRVAFALDRGRWPFDDVDHRDGDGLNNRPDNLREATDAQNMRNAAGRGGSSRFCGPTWVECAGKWRVYCADSAGNKHHLGYFADEVEAALAYDRAAREWHGDFARLNFP